MKGSILIIGAGGHARVVYDALMLQKRHTPVGFADAVVPVGSEVIDGCKVVVSQSELSSMKNKAEYFIVAIGNNKIRAELFDQMRSILKPATIIHPSAVVGSGVSIGAGTVVLPNAVLNTNSRIGENSIVNCRVVVDHDAAIGAHVHLSIGTMVGSGSVIADHYLSGIGENIKPFSNIG